MRPVARDGDGPGGLRGATAAIVAGVALVATVVGAPAAGAGPTFLGATSAVTTVASTVPGNGDMNPYGVAVVPESVGLLNGPLGLTVAPNGDILTVNAGDVLAVETTPSGAQVAHTVLDGTGTPPGFGTLFGLAVTPGGTSLYFVDDGSNTLNRLS